LWNLVKLNHILYIVWSDRREVSGLANAGLEKGRGGAGPDSAQEMFNGLRIPLSISAHLVEVTHTVHVLYWHMGSLAGCVGVFL